MFKLLDAGYKDESNEFICLEKRKALFDTDAKQ